MSDKGNKAVVDWTPVDFERKFGQPAANPETLRQIVAGITKTASATAAATTTANAVGARAEVEVIALPLLDRQEQLALDISHGTEALSCLLRLAGFDTSHRVIIDALIGIAGEHIEKRFADLDEEDPRTDYAIDWDTAWFESTYLKIGTVARVQVRDAEDNVTEPQAATLKQWAGRRVRALKEAQKLRNFFFFGIQESKFDGQIIPPTKFRLPILRYIAQTITQARAKGYFMRQPNRAIREAAREVLNDVPDVPYVKERASARVRDPETRLNSNCKAIRTLLKQVAEDADWLQRDKDGIFELLLRDAGRILGIEPETVEQLRETLSACQGGGVKVEGGGVTGDPTPLSAIETDYEDASSDEQRAADDYEADEAVRERVMPSSEIKRQDMIGNILRFEDRSGSPLARAPDDRNGESPPASNFLTKDSATRAGGVPRDQGTGAAHFKTDPIYKERIGSKVNSAAVEDEEGEWIF